MSLGFENNIRTAWSTNLETMVENHRTTNDSFFYPKNEPNWSQNTTMCQGAIDKCMEILQSLSTLHQSYLDIESLANLLKNYKQMTENFLHHFEDKKQFSKQMARNLQIIRIMKFVVFIGLATSMVIYSEVGILDNNKYIPNITKAAITILALTCFYNSNKLDKFKDSQSNDLNSKFKNTEHPGLMILRNRRDDTILLKLTE